jgi:hypothetical protein
VITVLRQFLIIILSTRVGIYQVTQHSVGVVLSVFPNTSAVVDQRWRKVIDWISFSKRDRVVYSHKFIGDDNTTVGCCISSWATGAVTSLYPKGKRESLVEEKKTAPSSREEKVIVFRFTCCFYLDFLHFLVPHVTPHKMSRPMNLVALVLLTFSGIGTIF